MIPPFQYIDSPAALHSACQHLQGQPELAFDLEFDDNRYTYGRTLCLIQVASRTACFLIDPFYCGPLQCLWEVLENPAINKVFHSATQDILILKEAGCNPVNLTDTETVARLLNYERASFANMLLQKLNLTIDKDQQTSNWTKRPLNHHQLEYAAKDVLYLLALKEVLMQELVQAGRLPWLEEESQLLQNIRQAANPDPHLKLKDATRLTLYQQHVLKAIFEWRNAIGRKFNQPGPRVISNALAVSLAIEPIRDLETWKRTEGVFGPIRNAQHFESLLDAIFEAEEDATDRKLSQKPYFPPRLPRFFSGQQAAACNAALGAVRQALIQKYGPYTTELVLTSTLIKRACNGPAVQLTKRYAYQLIAETAADLGLQIQEYLLPPGPGATPEPDES